MIETENVRKELRFPFILIVFARSIRTLKQNNSYLNLNEFLVLNEKNKSGLLPGPF